MNGTMETEDREEADAVKSEIDDEDVNMDSNSEVHKSTMNTKQADPVLNGRDNLDSALANGEGDLSTPNLRLVSVY